MSVEVSRLVMSYSVITRTIATVRQAAQNTKDRGEFPRGGFATVSPYSRTQTRWSVLGFLDGRVSSSHSNRLAEGAMPQ